MLRLHSIFVILLLVTITISTPNSDAQNSKNEGKSVGSVPDHNPNEKSNGEKDVVDESHTKELETNVNDNKAYHEDGSSNLKNSIVADEIKESSEGLSQESNTPDSSSETVGDLSEDALIFEELGGEDELLVDQMKRLSEKIKNKEKEMQQEGHNPEDVKTLKTNIHRKTVQNIPPPHSVEDFPSSVAEDLSNENGENKKPSDRQSIKKDSLTDKLIQDDEYFNFENYAEDILDAEHYDEADFPDDLYYDNNEPSEYNEANLKVEISNTVPPMPDILPSQTEIKQSVTLQSNEPLTADKVTMSSNPTITDKPHETSETPEMMEISSTDISNTARTDNAEIASPDTVQSTSFLGIKNAGRNYRLEKKMAERQKAMDGKQVQDTVTANDVTAAKMPHDQTENKHTQETYIYATGTVKDLKFTATVEGDRDKHEQHFETSDIPMEGLVQETATIQDMFSERNSEEGMKVEKDTENTVTKTAATTESSEDGMPSMTTQTVTDEGDTTNNEEQELTEEEKKKIAQAHQYFEQGEQLVNNSYKKDYLQAYEFFKLAADLGHMKAQEYLGFGHLLGDYIRLDPGKAIKIFTELGERGSPRGQLGLGFCYGSGLAVNSSQAKALIYFTFAALGGDPFGQMVLGYRYLSGIGVESKCETALQFYRKVATTVAEQTSSGSPVIQRIRLHEQADNKESGSSLMDADLLQYYEFLADKGDLQAQVVLGQLYYQGGRGVPINHERAHHYFLMAAESGNANALAFLGKMHSEGSPYIKQDNLTAYQYFKKAADKGNPIGLCGLGTMHFHGKGVDKDYVKALKYFTQSADQGWSDGQLQLGLMHYSGKGVKRDYKQAVRYFNLASQGGHVLAFFHLAQMHATGIGVLRNCHTAVELYKNVAERGPWASMLMEAHQLYKEGNVNEALLKYTFLAELGYEVAQTNVAYILDQGESSLFTETETYQRALLQWTRAASQGSTVARLKMGDYHYYGYGTEIDYETAASHYRMATEQQHNAQAMFNLGYMHEQGLGLKQDIHLAKRFYDMAAETSGDAYVPVTLALIKMGLFYGVDVFNKELEGYNDVFKRVDVRYLLGPNWDIYLATFLAIVLGIVVVIRRQR